jgi:ribosome biogenesis protein Nip4
MTYFDLYKDRITASGQSSSESILNASQQSFDSQFSEALFTETVLVNGIEVETMIISTTNYDERRILFRKDEIRHGDLIDHENYKWLVTELPFFNKIHSKSKMVIANGEMVFQYTISTGEQEYDRYGNPIPGSGGEETVTETFPCVIKSITELETMTGQKINIAEGEMALLLPYSDNPLLQLGKEFNMFDDNYRITGVDRSKVIDGSGVLTLIVSKNT